MMIVLPLEPQKEAKRIALAQEKGLTAAELVSAAIDQIIAEVPDVMAAKEPSASLRGLLAKYGPAPSPEEIDQTRPICSPISRAPISDDRSDSRHPYCNLVSIFGSAPGESGVRLSSII